MFSKKGEISTLVVLGVLSIIGVATFINATTNNNRNTLNTRAEYDGTSCNDNIGDSLNTSGSTAFTINCWGKLDRAYSYVLFWCPSKSKGATYCGDPSEVSSGQAQVLDRANGAVVPSTLSKSIDKTCGCVQWDVGVGGANAQDGVAGGAIMCAATACAGSNTSTPGPTIEPTNSSNNSSTQTSTPTPTTEVPLADILRDKTPTPTPSITCPGTMKKCLGTNVCRQSAAECPNADTPTPTKTPSPTTKATITPSPTIVCTGATKKCLGSNVCRQSAAECPNADTPTPTQKPTSIPTPTSVMNCEKNRVWCARLEKCISPQETCPTQASSQQVPTPTPVRYTTQNDTYMKSCFQNGTLVTIGSCILENGLDSFNSLFK